MNDLHWRIWLLITLAISCWAVTPRNAQGDDALAKWIGRTEEYRAAIEDVDELAAVDVALGVIYAKTGNAEKALATARRLAASESEIATSELSQVGM